MKEAVIVIVGWGPPSHGPLHGTESPTYRNSRTVASVPDGTQRVQAPNYCSDTGTARQHKIPIAR